MESNTYFDNHADGYADSITSIQPIFYENSRNIINSYIKPNVVMLDIGNGGVINYETTSIKHLDCADIVIPNNVEDKYKESNNISFIQADVTNLAGIDNETYDLVLIQLVLHHLAKPTYSKTKENVIKAINECLRVLKKDGTLIIIESTVSRWFEIVERILYHFMQFFFWITKFGCVFQFSGKSLKKLIDTNTTGYIKKWGEIKYGSRIWIMGHNIPRKLTPCGAHFYEVRKDEN